MLLVLFQSLPVSATLTTAGTIIRNGGDNGSSTYQNGISQPGDVILRYKNTWGTETVTTCNIVSTLVWQGYGISAFDKLPDQLLGGSRTIYYSYTLTNTGNGTDTITLSIDNKSLPQGWQVKLIEDTNQDGIHQATETTSIGSVTLLAGQSKYFFLQVVVPDGGNEGERTTTQITASSSDIDTWGMPDTRMATVTTGFDITPPKILHTPMTKIGMLGNKVVINGTITDGTIVDKALLYYGTQTPEICGTMAAEPNSIYSYSIPGDVVGTTGITYQIYSTDGLNATLTQRYKIEVCLTTEGTITNQGGTITIIDGNPEDGETKIIIPENEMAPEGGTVSITQKPVEEAPETTGNFLIKGDKPAAFYEFNSPREEFNNKVTITMLYLDVDNDGYEDITGEDERTLKVFYWNDSKKEWELMGGVIDPIKNTITIEVYHLSEFAIFPSKKPATKRLSKVFVYPNPCYPCRHGYQLTFAELTTNVTIKIFSITGELVRTLEKNDIGQEKSWDLRNDAYENVASGIYIYLIVDNDTGEKVTGKLGVIK
ncbi:MAG: T9SS type A sorting domain-containing protein [bacterium]